MPPNPAKPSAGAGEPSAGAGEIEPSASAGDEENASEREVRANDVTNGVADIGAQGKIGARNSREANAAEEFAQVAGLPLPLLGFLGVMLKSAKVVSDLCPRPAESRGQKAVLSGYGGHTSPAQHGRQGVHASHGAGQPTQAQWARCSYTAGRWPGGSAHGPSWSLGFRQPGWLCLWYCWWPLCLGGCSCRPVRARGPFHKAAVPTWAQPASSNCPCPHGPVAFALAVRADRLLTSLACAIGRRTQERRVALSETFPAPERTVSFAAVCLALALALSEGIQIPVCLRLSGRLWRLWRKCGIRPWICSSSSPRVHSKTLWGCGQKS